MSHARHEASERKESGTNLYRKHATYIFVIILLENCFWKVSEQIETRLFIKVRNKSLIENVFWF